MAVLLMGLLLIRQSQGHSWPQKAPGLYHVVLSPQTGFL